MTGFRPLLQLMGLEMSAQTREKGCLDHRLDAGVGGGAGGGV